MIGTHNQNSKESPQFSFISDALSSHDNEAETILPINAKTASLPLILPGRVITHNPKAGLNPVVDAAGYLFSVLGKLKQAQSHRPLGKLQKELIQEITLFQEAVKHYNYNAEYVIICRYILCATFDDIISNTDWGGQGEWQPYLLLATFDQDTQHQDKFFTIMERAITEPALYIDLMELMYLCLSMGYKGQYRSTEHSQYQPEQITNTLYKHIRAYRGSFSKTLSPTPLKPPRFAKKTATQPPTSIILAAVVTACVIMAIFVSLGYLMDVISNEAYKNFAKIENPVSHESTEQ